ncbi:HAMP domain-containing histidine kinase [Leptolyngbya sp. 15MV]|nr:HAMP domain-containing histidine kinase [Leptolyngbya sp. 15MV]
MRLWPRSLLGQVLLAVMAALLVAQAASAVLLVRAAENRRDAAMLNAAALQLVRQQEPRPERERRREWRERNGERGAFMPRMPRPLRVEWTDAPRILAGERRDAHREEELADLLGLQGVAVAETMVFERRAGADPFVATHPRLAERMRREQAWDRKLLVAALRREGAEQWSVARVPEPPVQRGVYRTIVVQTLVLFLVLVGALWLLLRRITRPLATLTRRTERFARTRQAGEPLAPQGPDDIQRLIAAHNAMEARIGALLDEKDVMLGAIGHDLKTPLAALRVRIESVEDERERGKMAAGIEDIVRSLDDILALARVGRSDAPPERTDLAALTAAVVEEFEDMGEPVELGESRRLVRAVHVTWLRRALRNLISNAVRYGGAAHVSLVEEQGAAVLRVDDRGPGIPADRIWRASLSFLPVGCSVRSPMSSAISTHSFAKPAGAFTASPAWGTLQARPPIPRSAGASTRCGRRSPAARCRR